MFGSITGKYVFPSVEVRVDVPEKKVPSIFSALLLTSKQGTVKICINPKTKESFIWAPHEFSFSVSTRKGKDSQKILNTQRCGWSPVPHHFADEVARQFEQGKKPIGLERHETQLTGRPAA